LSGGTSPAMTESICDKLKKLRKNRKISMSELAKASGIHQTTISAIENGRHSSPGIDTVEKLANALKVSPLYFFEERVITPFDLDAELPPDVMNFLLSAESLPYIKLSKDAYEKGVSSETIRHFLELLQMTAKNSTEKQLEKEQKVDSI